MSEYVKERCDVSDGFFLIHNYNTVPTDLLACCRPDRYLIVDASDDGKTPEKLASAGLRWIHIPNTGHNITTYFSYFADDYERLPEVMFLLKGNLLQRHCSPEYFHRVLHNTWFTYLYEEKNMRPRYSKPTAEMIRQNGGKDPSAGSIARLASESRFLEDNNSWYMQQESHPHRYFDNYDDFLCFVYVDPVIPKEIMFSPGACYIVRREQILLHSPAFYRNLNKLMSYTLGPGFPAEAYLVERMLPVIFESTYPVQPWMDDEALFDSKIEEVRKNLSRREEAERERQKGSIRHKIGQILRKGK